MSNYLVTGAAGFVAYWVTSQLLEQGHSVVGIDNLNNAYDPRIKQWRLKQLESDKQFQFIQADLSEAETLKFIFQENEFKAVIHLGARAGARQSTINPQFYVDSNVTGTLNVLDYCLQYDIRKMVMASTSSLYGSNNPLPFNEEANTDQPLSPYTATKKAAESLAHAYHHLYGIDITILRYFTVYGPAGRPNMSLFRFIHWVREGLPVILHGDGSQSRDFTYATDIARGTIAALKPQGCNVINLGSGTRNTLAEALKIIEKCVKNSAIIYHEPLQRTDVASTQADIGKARELLGWEPSEFLDDGIQKTVDWYEQNRNWVSSLNFGQ